MFRASIISLARFSSLILSRNDTCYSVGFNHEKNGEVYIGPIYRVYSRNELAIIFPVLREGMFPFFFSTTYRSAHRAQLLTSRSYPGQPDSGSYFFLRYNLDCFPLISMPRAEKWTICTCASLVRENKGYANILHVVVLTAKSVACIQRGTTLGTDRTVHLGGQHFRTSNYWAARLVPGTAF